MLSDLVGHYWDRAANATTVSAQSLGLFRWLLGIYLLLFQAPFYRWIDEAPRAFFDPPPFGVSNLVDGFPPAPFFLLVDLVLTLGILAVTLGWYTRLTTALVIGLVLVGDSFHYSFGKIDHVRVGLISLLACMIVADWGRCHSLDARAVRPSRGRSGVGPADPRRIRQAMALFATVLAFGFVTAGVPKIPVWLDLNLATSGLHSWYYPARFVLGRDVLLAPVVPRLPALVLEAAEYLAILVEVSGFLLLLLGRRAWLSFLLVCSLFHLANALLLNIPFAGQVVLYLVFVDLHALSGRVRQVVPRLVAGVEAAVKPVAAAAAVWHLIGTIGGFSSPVFFLFGRTHLQLTQLIICIVACLAVAAALGWNLAQLGGRRGRTTPGDAQPVASPPWGDAAAPVV